MKRLELECGDVFTYFEKNLQSTILIEKDGGFYVRILQLHVEPAVFFFSEEREARGFNNNLWGIEDESTT